MKCSPQEEQRAKCQTWSYADRVNIRSVLESPQSGQAAGWPFRSPWFSNIMAREPASPLPPRCLAFSITQGQQLSQLSTPKPTAVMRT